MSEDFDSSPRASKRRRTTRYGIQRTTLPDYDRTQDVQVAEDAQNDRNSEQHVLESANGTELSTPTKRSTRRSVNTNTLAQDDVDSPTLCAETNGADYNSTTAMNTLEREKKNPSRSKSKLNQVKGKKRDDVHEEEGHSDVDLQMQKELETHQIQEGTEVSTPQKRSSRRERRPTRRLVETLDDDNVVKGSLIASSIPKTASESITTSPVLKGILTPSRKQKQKGAPRKSVVFNDQEDREIGEQLGFRDISTPTVKKLPKKSTPYPKKTKEAVVVENTGQQDAVNADGLHENDVLDPMLIDEHDIEIPIPVIAVGTPFLKVNLTEGDSNVSTPRYNVLSRLTSASLPAQPPSHLQAQYAQLHSLLSSTVASSESNSLLLLGPRGSGKSLLVNIALRELTARHPNDFHIVRLNGFLQTDDRIALREIWRQLGHSRDLDETETEDIGASYADTMASLLSLLSHPDEMVTEQPAPNNMQGIQQASKSIVFILDEFDLFTTHPRQTLLYNLFDIAQSRKAPIAVVGCSSRMDVIECLEKRVKSRFSHRWLLVAGCKSLTEWEAEIKNALCVSGSEEEQSMRTKEEEEQIKSWNQAVEQTLLSSKEVQGLIKSHFYTTKSLPDLFMSLYPLVATLQVPTSASCSVKDTSIPGAVSRLHQLNFPSIMSALITLPVLHLSLIISMCRLETIHALIVSNFNLVYTHYTELIQSSRLRQIAHGSVTHSGTLRQWSRETCREAWEELGFGGFIVPAVGGRDDDGGLGVGEAGEAEETRMWRCEVGLEDVLWAIREKFEGDGDAGVGAGAGEVLVKWCREV